ncbi:MAG: hypothetical protein R3C20_18985 [Planctomycetaceae bacterium]
MSEIESSVLVTDRRSGRRRQAPARNITRSASAVRKSEVIPEAADTLTEEEIARRERREIADRRRADRRRQIDPTTCERDYSGGEIEFMRAMDDYKRKSGRPFPTWSEVLEVLMSLGYRKVAEPTKMEWRTFGDSSASNSGD